MKQLSSIQSRVWDVEYDFMNAKLTGCGAGSEESGLSDLLERGLNGTLKMRRCDATDAQHRGKQGQGNVFRGPLIDLDLHHPPCRSFTANQAFYLCGLLAQALLCAVQYWLLPLDEWRCSLGNHHSARGA